ncbi:hypothetical protein ABIB34_002980 [Rhodococcus sp. UYP5]
MLASMADTLLRVILGTAILTTIYSALRSNWPTSYFSASDLMTDWFSVNLHRYLLFRFIPVFLVSLCACSGLENQFTERVTVGSAIAIIHISQTSLRAAIASRADRIQNRSAAIIAQSLIVFGVLLTTAAAVLYQPLVSDILPDWSDYFQALITAVFVTCFGFAAITITRRQEQGPGESVEVLEKDFVSTIIRWSHHYKVDSDVALAIFATENSQRPKWVRRAEKMLGRFGLVRTFGIGQTSPTPPTSMDEDVQNTLAPLAGSNFLGIDQYGRRTWAEVYFERHNQSQTFVDFAAQRWQEYDSRTTKTEWIGSTGNPILRSSYQLRRVAQTFIASGTATEDVKLLIVTAPDGSSQVVQLPPISNRADGLREWNVSSPLMSGGLRIEAALVTPNIDATPDARTVSLYG